MVEELGASGGESGASIMILSERSWGKGECCGADSY